MDDKKWLNLKFLKEAGLIAFFFFISFFIHFYYANFADNDSFFYIREAWRLRMEGFFKVDFPWTYFSMIREYGISLWWGFLVLLYPFTFFQDLRTGIKAAGVVFTFLGLLVFYLAIKKGKLKWPFLWPFFYLFSAPNVMYRMMMVRPQVISTALTFLLLAVLMDGSLWMVLAISFLITWIHFNFFFVPVLIYAAYFLAEIILERKADFKKGMAVFGGVILGWIARPEFIKAGKLVYVQIVEQTLVKQAGAPLLFGEENEPLLFVTLFKNFWPIILIFIFSIFTLVKFYFDKYKKGDGFKTGERGETFILTSFILASGFLFLAMFSARRAYDFWVGFTILMIAAIWTNIIPKISFKTKNVFNNILKYGAAILFAFSFFNSTYKTDASIKKAYEPDDYREAAEWILLNSQEKDIVFNLNWARFSQLFFWNQKNYYIGGLDPIFQYVYDKDLYWKFHYLSLDMVTKKTCGKEECKVEDLEDTYQVLKNEFKAKYVFLEKEQNPAVYWYLGQDRRFEKKFENKKEVVFEVK